jgi:hypothetical protein
MRNRPPQLPAKPAGPNCTEACDPKFCCCVIMPENAIVAYVQLE